jgi:hypothetical protein
MSDRVDSPGTTTAIAEAAKVLNRGIDDADLALRLADRIVEELQTRQYHGGMRVLLDAWQGRDYRSGLIAAVINDIPVEGLHLYAVSDAMGVAAHVLWDAESSR